MTASGEVPFERWLDGLRDRIARAKVRVQLDRVSTGNFGTCRHFKGGISELKIAWGPGYRVYFARTGLRSVLLLCGGDKSSQRRDIAGALAYWTDFRRRRRGKTT